MIPKSLSNLIEKLETLSEVVTSPVLSPNPERANETFQKWISEFKNNIESALYSGLIEEDYDDIVSNVPYKFNKKIYVWLPYTESTFIVQPNENAIDKITHEIYSRRGKNGFLHRKCPEGQSRG